jgi:hypothetical protein
MGDGSSSGGLGQRIAEPQGNADLMGREQKPNLEVDGAQGRQSSEGPASSAWDRI